MRFLVSFGNFLILVCLEKGKQNFLRSHGTKAYGLTTTLVGFVRFRFNRLTATGRNPQQSGVCITPLLRQRQYCCVTKSSQTARPCLPRAATLSYCYQSPIPERSSSADGGHLAEVCLNQAPLTTQLVGPIPHSPAALARTEVSLLSRSSLCVGLWNSLLNC